MAKIGSHVFERARGVVLILCLAVFGLSFQTAQATEQRTFPLIDDPQFGPIMAVQVNSIDTTALLDTGATIGLVFDDFLSEDQVPVSFENTANILGLGGLREYPIMELKDLSVGARTWSDVRVAVNTSNRFPVDHNILPISLFQSSIVDFEFNKALVHFYDGRPRRVREKIKSTVKYVDTQRLIFAPIKINGIRGLALIDTGAQRSFVNPMYATQSKAVAVIREQERMQGSDLSRNTAQLYTFRDFRLGAFRAAKTNIPVLQTDLFDELGYADAPMMVIGMDFLQHFRVQIDRKRKRITFVQMITDKRRNRNRMRTQHNNQIHRQ